MQEFDADLQLAERLDASLLITGESDAETEDIARMVHGRSQRQDAPFVTIHCGNVSDAQFESQLLGDKHRSLYGATAENTGRLQQASGGSLVMVDVGELGRPMQEALLRFLTTGAFHYPERPSRVVDVRIIATTSRPLFERVVAGNFRDDLYYRLNVIHISIPPLRERREDIPSLTSEILRDLSQRQGTIAPPIAPAAMMLLQAYDWPGNMRELRDVLTTLHLSAHGRTIEADDLPPAVASRLQSRVRTSIKSDGPVVGRPLH